MLLSAAGATAQDAPPHDNDPRVAPLIGQLADDEWEVRERATSALIGIGSACAGPVVEAMNRSDSAEVRTRARRILLAIGAWRMDPGLVREKVQELLEVLRDGEVVVWNPESRAAPLDLLEQYDDRFGDLYAEPRSVPPLVEALADDDPTFVANVAWCLGRTGSREAVPALRAIVGRTEIEEHTRAIALAALARIGDAASAPTVTQALGDPSLMVRQAAAIVAERLGEKSAVPVLIGLLEDGDAALRFNAFYTLARMTGERFGYNAFAAPERRAGAVGTWRAWWTEHGSGFEPGRGSVDSPGGEEVKGAGD